MRKIELIVYIYQTSYQSGEMYSTTVNTAFFSSLSLLNMMTASVR